MQAFFVVKMAYDIIPHGGSVCKMAYLLIFPLIFIIFPLIGMAIWFAASAVLGLVIGSIASKNRSHGDKIIFVIMKILALLTILALIWKALVIINANQFVNTYRGSALLFTHAVILFAIISTVILAIIKKSAAFDGLKPKLHAGMLAASIVYLAIVGMPHGWLTEGPRATWTDQPRITDCGQYRYYINVRRTWRVNAKVTLIATNLSTNQTYTIALPTDEYFGRRYPAPPMRNDRAASWASLEPANNHQHMFILTTCDRSLFYRRIAFEIDFYTGTTTSVPPVDYEYLYYTPFTTTPDGLFNTRLEWWQLVQATRGASELRLHMVNVDTDEEHRFTLIVGSTTPIASLPFSRAPQHEEIMILPTESPYIYTAILPNRFAVFEINLKENTSTLAQEYSYSAWHATSDSTLEYRIIVPFIGYSRRRFSGISSHSPSAHVILQLRDTFSGTESSMYLPQSIARHVTFNDVVSHPLDWLTIHSQEYSELYIAEILLPESTHREAFHVRFTLRASPTVRFVAWL